MPRAKIDYVVSFSSEDPDNPASNLLAWDVSKKRWLGGRGEPSCSVVLQLTKAVQINAVHIGAYHAALVEVLVGRSEKPNEPFEVLVPSCVFLSPAESRREERVERVRSFAAPQLAPARLQRWDRLRLVCSQPYNKHCKYGLNFVHIYSEGPEPVMATPALSRLAAADAPSSSDDEFTPGELFAQHKASQDQTQPSSVADTGAQIRQATSQALKNISDSSSKLVKTPISKPSLKRHERGEPSRSNRHRDDLMYTDDDDRPHAKIDHIVQRHKDDKSKEDAKKPRSSEKPDRKKDDRNESFRTDVKKEDSRRESHSDKHRDRGDKTPKDENKNKQTPAKEARDEPSTSDRRGSDADRKRARDAQSSNKAATGDISSLLAGVVFALSGYANPRRAALRDLALSMGARCERDWNDRCNHLICAFPNTPKLKQVRAGPGGGAVPVVRGEWLEASRRRRRRLPWRWFATEPQHQLPPAPSDDDDDAPSDPAEECDTDDEIEKALRTQKKRRTDRSRSPASTRTPPPPTVDDDATDDENFPGPGSGAAAAGAAGAGLREVFAGRAFLIDGSAAEATAPALLARYVTARGGLVLQESELDEDSSVDYILSTRRVAAAGRGSGRGAAGRGAAGAACVRPDWVWRCHDQDALCPLDDYLITA